MNELALFTDALARTDPADRAAFLEEACAGNPDVRRRLDELLAAHARGGSPLDRPPVAPAGFAATADLPAEPGTEDYGPGGATGTFGDTPAGRDRSTAVALGAVIAGRYALVELIGEGGMGSVYLARQSEPVKRQVALKLIKAGMDSKAVLARFDAERQALAMMDHPNIARVFDGGVTPTGQPFFVMELVKGVPLTEYCDEHRLSVDARLQLFVSVCNAVQHAHQKGIIHRDLKPGNVLVTEVDGRPTPKVIDFGVAKATELKLTDMSFADTGAIVGTPAYMSPEQADPSSMDIDTRTDVYALGVMLYELLTGSPPIDSKQFKRGAVLEMLRMVREVEPPRPSTRLSAADDLPNIAANRSIDPAKLAKLLQGELDWVVMKALEKDRTRRYDTANGLARDIQRYLADEVVEARPPSRGYRFKKFVRRHKGQVIAASLVLFALVAGIGGTTWQAFRAEAARQTEAGLRSLADDRWTEAERARAEEAKTAAAEKIARAQAEGRLGELKRVIDTLGTVFRQLDPTVVQKEGKPLLALLADRLEQAADSVDGEAIGDPLAFADLQRALGASLITLGKPERAVPLLEKAAATFAAARGAESDEALTTRNLLGAAHQYDGNLRAAIPIYEDVLRVRERQGTEERKLLIVRDNLALAYSQDGQFERSATLFEALAQRFEALGGPADRDTIIAKNNLAVAYSRMRRGADAVRLLQPTLKLAEKTFDADHPTVITTRTNLAEGLHSVGRTEEAVAMAQLALRQAEAKVGPEHALSVTAANNLGVLLTQAGRPDLGVPLLERVWKSKAKQHGEGHPDTLLVRNNLAVSYLAVGKIAAALELQRETLRLAEAGRTANQTDTFRYRDEYVNMLQGAGRLPEAAEVCERNSRAAAEALGPKNWYTLKFRNHLGSLYAFQRKFDIAFPLIEDTLKTLIQEFGPDDAETISARTSLGYAFNQTGRYDRSIPLLEESFRQLEGQRGAHHPSLWLTWINLASAYRLAGRPEKAVALFERVLKAVEDKIGKEHEFTKRVRDQLLQAYQDGGKKGLAVQTLEELLTAQEEKLGRTNAVTVATRLKLAQAYQSAGMADRAIPLFEQVVAVREADLGPGHADTVAARSSLAFTLGSGLRWEEAVRLRERNAEVLHTLPEADERRLTAQSALADALSGAKQFDRAIKVLEAVLRVRQEQRKANPVADLFELNRTRSALANVYLRADRPREAIPLFEEVLRFNVDKWGEDNKSTLYARTFLAQAHLNAGDAGAAQRIYEKLVPALDRQFSPTDFMPVVARRNWAASLEQVGRYESAVAVRKEVVEFERKIKTPSGLGLQMALEKLGEAQLKAKQPAEAEPTFRELIRLLEKPGVVSPALFAAKSGLGASLTARQKYEEAELLLLTAFDGLNVLEAKLSSPPVRTQLLETADRLIALYTATNKPDEVKKGQAARAKHPEVAPPPREKR